MAVDDLSDDGMLLAAELALGVLESAELDRARALQRDDQAFAAAVDLWHEHFAALFAQIPDAAPPPSLARRVRAAAGLGAANSNDVVRWKWATSLAASIAAGLAILLLVPAPQQLAPPGPAAVRPAQPGAAMTVAFAVNEGAQTLPAVVDVSSKLLRLPSGLDVPAGRVAQLWLLEGEAAPKPIGLFEPTANGLAATVTLERAIPAGSVLAISIEPPGGSPTGLPTGPVVATGELKPV